MTPGAFIESAMYAGLSEADLKDWSLLAKVRYAVYRPGGPMAMDLSQNPTVLVVNETAFVHGGLLPAHGECVLSQRENVRGLGNRHLLRIPIYYHREFSFMCLISIPLHSELWDRAA